MLKSRIPKAITYTRVSTDNQSAYAQLAELRDYCRSREWAVDAEITDQGFSGSADKRPGLMHLMTIVRARKADTDVDEMAALKVAFVSVNDQLDLTTPSGWLMLRLLEALIEPSC